MRWMDVQGDIGSLEESVGQACHVRKPGDPDLGDEGGDRTSDEKRPGNLHVASPGAKIVTSPEGLSPVRGLCAAKRAVILKNLQHLVTAAQSGSFHKAADRLGTVQSALSRRISELEHALGGPVFYREPSGVRLTKAGEALVESGGRLLDDIDRMVRHFELTHEGQRSSLKIAFNGPAMMHPPLPLGMQAFRKSHPNVDLQLHPLLSQAQFTLLERGAIDVGVAFDLGLKSALTSRRIATDRLALAIPVHHPLADQPSLAIEDLAGEDVISMDRPSSSRLSDLAFEQLVRAGVDVRSGITAASTEAALSLVAGGLGLAFINRSQIGREPPNVRIRDLAGFDVELPLCLFWSPSVETPLILSFADAIADAFAVHGPSGGARLAAAAFV